MRRSSSNARSPANRARKREGEADSKPTFPNGKAPDPNEFEPEFIIGEDEAPSRTATPVAHKEEADKSGTGEQEEDDGVEDKKGGEAQEAEGEKAEPARDDRAAPPQIPLEVRKRLLRLEKLEPKYQGATQSISWFDRGGTADRNTCIRASAFIPNCARQGPQYRSLRSDAA